MRPPKFEFGRKAHADLHAKTRLLLRIIELRIGVNRSLRAPTGVTLMRGSGRSEGAALAEVKAERAALGAKGRPIETEAAPIRYVAELVGADADSERAIRWLIALMVLCCDPLAIALTAAASARR